MKSKSRQIIALSLLSLMLVKVWVIPLLYLDFEVRRDYIVANLCENRSKPQLNCNGKCYLAKKMAAIQEQEKKQAEQNFIVKLIDFPAQPAHQFKFKTPKTVFEALSAQVYHYRAINLLPVAIEDVFHPPAFI